MAATIDRTNIARLGVWHNGYDTVVAFSAEDAMAICEELSGEASEDEACDWTRHADDDLIPIFNGGPGETRLELSAIDWTIYNGRGFLCSTEY